MTVTQAFPCSARLARALLMLVAAAPMLLGLTSCGVTTKRYPVTEVVQAANERVFWNALRVAITKEEFLVGGVSADPSKRSITSGWKVDATPFGRIRSSRSFRSRVIAKYEPVRDMEALPRDVERPRVVDPDKEAFLLTVRVEIENNESLRPLVARHAKWTAADDDKVLAEKLMYSLRLNVEDIKFELSEDDKGGPPYDLDLDLD